MVSPAPKPALDETRVLDAAFDVLEAEGFAGLTIRRIAERLGVKNPALYWHFRNKQEIVNGMASRLLDRMTEAPLSSGDWRDWLQDAAKWYRQTLLGVRDGAEILSNANLSRSRHFAEFQRGIAYLAAQGFSDRDALLGMVTIFDYALGVTYEHQADARLAASSPAEKAETDEPSASMFASLGSIVRDAAREALFEGGLELILDGLALRRKA